MSVPSQARPGRHLRVLRPLRRHSDARLIELARRGNEDAFSCLVDRYRGELEIYAHRLVGAQSRAEDALQQALFGAWLALRNHDREIANPRAWLYRCVHNAAVTILRRAQHDTITLEDARTAGAEAPGADRRTELSAVITELGRLPEGERRALLMTSVSGASHEEAAETLGVSRAAVRGMVYRARTSLRTAVGGAMPWGAWNWLSNLAGGGAGDGVGVAAGSAGLGAAVLKGGAVIAAIGAVGVAGDRVLTHHSSSHAARSRVALTGRDASDSAVAPSSRHARGAATRNAPSEGAADSTTAASFAAPDRGDRAGGRPGRPAGSPGRDEHHRRGDDRHRGRHDGDRHGGRTGAGSTPGGPGRGAPGRPTSTSPTSGPPRTGGPPTTTSPRSGSPTTTQPTSEPPTRSSPGGPPTTTGSRGGTDDRGGTTHSGGDDNGTSTSGSPASTTSAGRTDDGSGATETETGSGRPADAGKTAASGSSPGGSSTVTVATTGSPTTTTASSPGSGPTTTTGSATTTTTATTSTTATVTSTSTTSGDDGGGDRHGGG